jgi:hypothetical protein
MAEAMPLGLAILQLVNLGLLVLQILILLRLG